MFPELQVRGGRAGGVAAARARGARAAAPHRALAARRRPRAHLPTVTSAQLTL